MSFIYKPNFPSLLGASASKSLSGTGTVVVPVFRFTGVVRVYQFWGVITSKIGSDHDSAYIRLNDGSVIVNLSSSGGGRINLSNFAVGSFFEKVDLADQPLKGANASAAGFLEPAGGAGQEISTPFDVVSKNGGTTTLEYVYTTNNASAGAIEFFVQFLPFTVSGVEGTVVSV